MCESPDGGKKMTAPYWLMGETPGWRVAGATVTLWVYFILSSPRETVCVYIPWVIHTVYVQPCYARCRLECILAYSRTNWTCGAQRAITRFASLRFYYCYAARGTPRKSAPTVRRVSPSIYTKDNSLRSYITAMVALLYSVQ